MNIVNYAEKASTKENRIRISIASASAFGFPSVSRFVGESVHYTQSWKLRTALDKARLSL